MSSSKPHFLLYSDTTPPNEDEMGGWRFVLQSRRGGAQISASDREANMSRSRLELLAVIRGLEALEQPSRVTLITSSRYVGGGLRHGLEQWRQTNWQWDHFGVLTPIKNEDFWRRLDQALQYHTVECQQGSQPSRRGPIAFHVECATGGHAENRPTDGRMGEPPLLEQPLVSVGPVSSSRSNRDYSRQIDTNVVADPHWPRKRNRWQRAAMAIGTAAAAVTSIIAFRV